MRKEDYGELMPPDETDTPTPPPSKSAPRVKAVTTTTSKALPRGFGKRGKRVLIYGEGGSGKTTLATTLLGKTLFIDLEGSLPDLFDEGSLPPNITPYWPQSWEEVERAINSKNAREYQNIVVDSLTALESMFWRYIATHCRKAKEGYGMVTFSDTALPPLKDERELGGGGGDSAKYAMWSRFEEAINALSAEGVNIIDICHDCEKTKDDSSDGVETRHQPRLNDPNSGKNSIRMRAYEIHGEVWAIRWEKLRVDDNRMKLTGRRIVYGQPDVEHAADFVGLMTKSRRGFHVAYLDEFDINEVLGISAPAEPPAEPPPPTDE